MIQQWLLERTDQLISASNISVSIALFALGTVVLLHLRKFPYNQHVDLWHMMCGIVIETYGWGLHRAYYAILNTYKLYDNQEMMKFFFDHRYITLIPIGMVLIGLVMILGPVTSFVTNSEKRWKHMAIVAAAIFGVAWFSFWKLDDAYVYLRVGVHEKHIELLMNDSPAWKSLDKVSPPVNVE